jgi:hypothetical protein
MATVDEQLAQLQQQQSLQTQAIKAFLEGKLDGPGSAKAYLLALDPNLEITPAAFLIG